MEQAIHTPEQQPWLHKFLGYDFTIEYKSDKENQAIDALSRSYFIALSQPTWDLIIHLRDAVAVDSKLSDIVKLCNVSTPLSLHYTIQNKLLFWKQRLVVPTQHPLIQTILQKLHSSPIGGHSCIAYTLARVSSQFYWSGMNQDVKAYVQHCLICQQAKSSTTSPVGLLQPLPIP